jgi:hypothetical protein
MYGRYFIEFDRTGFPLIGEEGWDFAISVFPVSFYQFERFMADSGPKGKLYTDEWYSGFLGQVSRGVWRKSTEKIWELFIRGVEFEELLPFLKYLGENFRLPRMKEWRMLLQIEKQRLKECLKSLCEDERCAEPARLWIQRGLFPLAEEGILELVLPNDGESPYVDESKGRVYCLGKPLFALHPNFWKPEEVKEVNWEISKKMVGFRVVREIGR